MNPEARFTFAAKFKILKKEIKFLVHDCLVDTLHCVVEYFVSRSFKFRIHQENIIRTQLLFEIRIIHFVDDIVSINICCLDRKALLGVYVVVKRKIRETLDNEVYIWR